MAASWMAAADFGQVIKLVVRPKTPLGETGCMINWMPLHPGFSELLGSPPVLSSTQLLSVAYFSCSGIQFFNSPPFLTQSVRLPLVTYPSLCSICATYRMPCHVIGHQVLPTQPLPREAEDFPRGGSHPKHMPLLTYLAWLQPII